MFAYCLNNPVRYADYQGNLVHDCCDEADDPNNPFDDLETIGGGYRSLGVSSYHASGVAKYSNAGNGTGSMIGDMAYQQTKAANTTPMPTYGGFIEELLKLVKGTSSSQCFVAGTLIQTEDGLTPIEEIVVGDLVWAWDEITGDVAPKEVVETYVNETSELVHIFVNGEVIVTTPAHPFYSPVKGWTDAVHLRAGDILVLVNGEYVIVEKVQHEILEAPVTVYNFQVQDYHTYYVTESCILVHNSCGVPDNLSPAGAGRNGAFNQAKRDIGIPVSQQPDAVLPNYDKRGNLVPGRVYIYGDKFIRDDIVGHTYKDGGFVPRHFNTPNGGHYFY